MIKYAASHKAKHTPNSAGPMGTSLTLDPVPAWRQRASRTSAHGPVTVGAYVIYRGPGSLASPDASVGKVGGVDELVDVVALTEHRDVVPGADPFEQHLEDTQPPVAEDRARTDNRHVEASPGRIVAEPLTLVFCSPVGFAGGRDCLLGDGIHFGHAEDGIDEV